MVKKWEVKQKPVTNEGNKEDPLIGVTILTTPFQSLTRDNKEGWTVVNRKKGSRPPTVSFTDKVQLSSTMAEKLASIDEMGNEFCGEEGGGVGEPGKGSFPS